MSDSVFSVSSYILVLRFDTCLKVFDAHCHGLVLVKLEVDVASDFIVIGNVDFQAGVVDPSSKGR